MATGFSVDLIHRDSPKSPFYNNSSESISDRLSRAIQQSNSRVEYFVNSSSVATLIKGVSSSVRPGHGNYLMAIYLGTPPVEILAVVDTVSDLIWTQCSPPLFDPSRSSSYKEISCSSSSCWKLPEFGCTNNGSCMYSNGVLAAETLTMMASSDAGYVNLPNITFGCSSHFDNSRTGVVSLGGGAFSLVSQLGPFVGKKFSYCFVPYNQNASSSRIHFGDSAVVSGPRSVYTPSVLKPVSKSIIYVTLEYISVGDQSVFLPSIEKGNTIMDSGTTLTYLPTQAYRELLSVLKGAIDLAPVQDPSNNFDLCYEHGKYFNVPDLKFGFDAADELLLGPLNTFLLVDENVTCAAFFGSDSINSVMGSIARQNIKIGYDFDDMVVAFQPTDCAHDQ